MTPPEAYGSPPGVDVAHEESADEPSPDPARVRQLLREIARPSLAATPSASAIELPHEDSVIQGRFRLVRQIGSGGMGVVYEAAHVVSGKPVALKWMPPDKGSLPARLLLEARATGRIDHPNVVDVYDVLSDENGAYLVMELLRGETMAERLTRGPLSSGELIAILLPVLRGVEAAHRRGVIHRDLKPENIFLCEPSVPGGAVVPKVLDFGISKIVAATSAGASRLTRDGALLGTPAFMSPEQLRDPRHVDARSDIYSLGVVMFEALTGRLPFDASGRDALVIAIAEHRVRSLREIQPRVSRPLAAVISRAMAADPASRYPDATALIDALVAARDRRVVLASRRAMIACGVVVLAGLAITALAGSNGSGQDTTPPRGAVAAATPGTAHPVPVAPHTAAAPGAPETPSPLAAPAAEPSARLGPAPKTRKATPRIATSPSFATRAGELTVEDL